MNLLNERFGSIMKISGNFSLRKDNFRFSDPRMKSDEHILPPNMAMSQITNEENEILDKTLMQVYKFIEDTPVLT